MDDTINWKQKLSSRKFWAMVLSIVFGVVVALIDAGYEYEWLILAKVIIGAVIGGAGVTVYISTEGKVDAARIEAEAEATSKVITVNATTSNAATVDRLIGKEEPNG